VATLNIIEKDNLTENAARTGTYLRKGLEELQQEFPKIIGDVRGMGLMQALELVEDETVGNRTPNPKAADRLMEETKQRGLLLGRGGLYANTMRIAPPLNITVEEVDEALQILRDALQVFAA
jgi:4-aminobutyrate aminotransferase-like enzyme